MCPFASGCRRCSLAWLFPLQPCRRCGCLLRILRTSSSRLQNRLCERLFELAKVGSVGITTGEAFCGVVGSKTRKEYTILVRGFASDAVVAGPRSFADWK